MKKAIFSFLLYLSICNFANSQSAISQGKPIAEIFTDFHYNLNDSTKTTGFGLNRAYFGYNFLPAGNFSGSVIITVGSPVDLAPSSVPRRYAYFREVSVSYTKGDLRITGGITGTKIFDFQQKFWGKRYIANTFQSINGYGDVADLGIAVDYKFSDMLSGDFTVMNGEGYSDIQRDNGVRTSAGITYTPVKGTAVRIYGDIENVQNVTRYTLICFFGYKNEIMTIGAETNYKSDLDMNAGHNAWGISATGGVNIFKQTEIFARYDYATSATLSGDDTQWNYRKDGRFAVFGLQHTFSENVKLALDYQGNYPSKKVRQMTNTIYLNALFRF